MEQTIMDNVCQCVGNLVLQAVRGRRPVRTLANVVHNRLFSGHV